MKNQAEIDIVVMFYDKIYGFEISNSGNIGLN